jgi:hypothetical protein
MRVKSSTTKALAAVTAAGILTLGGTSAAFAADGSGGTGSRRAGTVAREHPGALRDALRAAGAAAAEALGMTTQELRAAVLEGPQSVASLAGDQAGTVTAAVEAALDGRIDAAEADGSITAEQAARLRERVPTAAERFMNKVPGTRAAGASR